MLVVLVLGLLEVCHCIQKTKCQVVQALRAQGVPDSDLRDWLCLVKHESNYHYDAVNSNTHDYGIFQINRGYWCDRPNGYSGTTCWRLNTYGCADTCASFTNSDITNDANCAVRIKNCKGFRDWYAWRDYCSDVSGSDYSYSGC